MPVSQATQGSPGALAYSRLINKTNLMRVARMYLPSQLLVHPIPSPIHLRTPSGQRVCRDKSKKRCHKATRLRLRSIRAGIWLCWASQTYTRGAKTCSIQHRLRGRARQTCVALACPTSRHEDLEIVASLVVDSHNLHSGQGVSGVIFTSAMCIASYSPYWDLRHHSTIVSVSCRLPNVAVRAAFEILTKCGYT